MVVCVNEWSQQAQQVVRCLSVQQLLQRCCGASLFAIRSWLCLSCTFVTISFQMAFPVLTHTCRYGDDLAYENSDAYVAEILALVRQQNIHQCSATQGILLEELEFKHMYDACIYFIGPHQLKPRDLKLMGSISKVVPVIPVIAKADCMTPEERQKFRDHINKSLASPTVQGKTVWHDFHCC